jgi:hypothetical protein
MGLASAVLADTWVRVEKDGTKTYSDRPLAGGTPVVLNSAQTYSAPAVPDPTRPAEIQSLEAAANFQYASCTISPRNDDTLQNPESVTISVSTSPPLRASDLVNISMDGSTLTTGQPTTMVEMPDRGTHSVSAQVVSRTGQTLCSANSTFHVQRTNLNSVQRRPPPQPPRPRPPRPTPR